MSKNATVESSLYEPFVVLKEDEERAVRFERLLDDAKGLMGEILTIVDASIVEERQNKSMKDLMKACFRDYLGRYERICYYEIRGSNPII